MGAAAELLDEVSALLEAAELALVQRQAVRWVPHKPHPKQAEFLAAPEYEVMYGGAAGGGKSDALLMDALSDVDVPGFSALILRKTYQDLAKPGAIMDRCAEWLMPTAARWNGNDKAWNFPSGAVLTFGHMQHDKDRFQYQGGEYQCVAYDELTHFSQTGYEYPTTRIRRTQNGGLDGIKLRVRSATNPGGVGHEWVARRWGIDENGRQDPEAAWNEDRNELRRFIPAKMDDNPSLAADEYRLTLANVDATTRAQLEEGLWIQDSTGLVLPLERANLCKISDVPRDALFGLGIDMGTSENEETLGIGVVAWSPTVPDTVWEVLAEKHAGMLIRELAARVREIEDEIEVGPWASDGFTFLVMDEGALGSGFGRELRKRHALPIIAAKKSDRLGYARLLRDAARDAHLQIVEDRCGPLIEEAKALLWHEDGKRMVGKNHAYDQLLYSWRMARAYASKEPDPPAPKPGTPEAAREYAQTLKRTLSNRNDKKNRKWWKQ